MFGTQPWRPIMGHYWNRNFIRWQIDQRLVLVTKRQTSHMDLDCDLTLGRRQIIKNSQFY